MPPSATDQQEHYSGTLINDLAKILDLQGILTRKERAVTDVLAEACEKERRELNTPFSYEWNLASEFYAAEMLERHPWEILMRARYLLFLAIRGDHPNSTYWECRQAYTDAYFILADAQKRLEH